MTKFNWIIISVLWACAGPLAAAETPVATWGANGIVVDIPYLELHLPGGGRQAFSVRLLQGEGESLVVDWHSLSELPLAKVPLEGRWRSNCFADPVEAGSGLFGSRELSFFDTDYSATTKVYNNPACSGLPLFTLAESGTFVRGGDIALEADGLQIESIRLVTTERTVDTRYAFDKDGRLYFDAANTAGVPSTPARIDFDLFYTRL